MSHKMPHFVWQKSETIFTSCLDVLTSCFTSDHKVISFLIKISCSTIIVYVLYIVYTSGSCHICLGLSICLTDYGLSFCLTWWWNFSILEYLQRLFAHSNSTFWQLFLQQNQLNFLGTNVCIDDQYSSLLF